MEQARLLVMADYVLPAEALQKTVTEVRLLDWSAIGSDEDFTGGFLMFPEKPETQISFLGTNPEGDHMLQWCGISIRISRNVIAFRFPALFRTWLDFEAFRIGLNRFLCKFLHPFQSTSLLFLPSHWETPEYNIRNEMHRKRLAQMQHKITHAETSFKRCRQHLAHCLGEAAPTLREAVGPTYWETSFFDADSGRLCCLAAIPTNTTPIAEIAEHITQELRFQCLPLFRENACAHAPYIRKKPSEPRSCQLQPDYDRRKYPDFRSAIEAEQAARWNAHCFFSMELRPTHVSIRFRKTATGLLYGPLKEDCLRFMRQMLLPFRPTEILLCSHTLLEDLQEESDFAQVRTHLEEHYTGYTSLEDIGSWSEGYVHGTARPHRVISSAIFPHG
ncbi:MAG: hypothetical protein J5516_07540 [Bacteroidales bacterium]|nr:hypothetical protein [Bacteroidales bacterium]